VTTAAIEVGCDLDAHTLISEFCNPNQLVQRAGRCNRKRSWKDARIVVVGDTLLDDRRSLSQSDLPRYADILGEMSTVGWFVPLALLELGHRPQVNDYRVRTMFAMLYEYVYEAERANKPLHDKGLVVTRDWEPKVTLATAWEEGAAPENPVEIGLQSCVASGAGKLTPGCQVYIQQYDEATGRWTRSEPAYGGSAYKAEIVVVVPSHGFFDRTLGYYNVPKVFIGMRPIGYERRVIYERPGASAPAGQALETYKVIWRYIGNLPRVDERADQDEPTPEEDVDDGADFASSEESDSDE
jgi:CRISPR-associated endonuclease/helicase Cas3